MAFREVTVGNFSDVPSKYVKLGQEPGIFTKEGKLRDIAAGDVLVEGIFLGTSTYEGGQYGPKTSFMVRDNEDDATLFINAWGHLASLVKKANLAADAIVRITYLGLEQMKGGNMPGSNAHTFKLEVDEDA